MPTLLTQLKDHVSRILFQSWNFEVHFELFVDFEAVFGIILDVNKDLNEISIEMKTVVPI